MFFEVLQSVWGPMEPLVWLTAVAVGLWVFLKDPVRRERFLGFIPTVVPVVFDRGEGKVLVAHLRPEQAGGGDLWILPQGRVMGSLIDSVIEVMSRELGVERGFKLLGSVMLGRVAMRGEYRLKRYMDPAEFSLALRWRGKAYIAFFVEASAQLTAVNPDPFLYDRAEFVFLKEARELLGNGHRANKVEVYRKLLDSLKSELQPEG